MVLFLISVHVESVGIELSFDGVRKDNKNKKKAKERSWVSSKEPSLSPMQFRSAHVTMRCDHEASIENGGSLRATFGSNSVVTRTAYD